MAESTSRELLRDAITLACLEHASYCRQRKLTFVDRREHARGLADAILRQIIDVAIDPSYEPLQGLGHVSEVEPSELPRWKPRVSLSRRDLEGDAE